jgi:hypothetical protein
MFLCDVVVWTIMSRCLWNCSSHFLVSRSRHSCSRTATLVIIYSRRAGASGHFCLVTCVRCKCNDQWSKFEMIRHAFCIEFFVSRFRRTYWASSQMEKVALSVLPRCVTWNIIVPIRTAKWTERQFSVQFNVELMCMLRCAKCDKAMSPAWQFYHGPVNRRNSYFLIL